MTVLAGTADGLYRIDGSAARLVPGDVSAIVADGPRLWAAVDGRELWHGDASGGLRRVATAPLLLRSLLVAGGEVYAGTEDARLLRLEGDRLGEVGGFGDVPGRDGWYTPWDGPPDTRSLAAAPDGWLLANVHVGGVPRSRDGGASWEPTIDVDADVHQVLVDPSGRLVLCAAALGLAVSEDAGATWRWRTEGLHGRYSRAVAVAGDQVLLSASLGSQGRQAALYRAPLEGNEPLVRCRAGLPEWFDGNVDTHCLVARGRTATAADGGTLYTSEDAGGHWRVLAGDLPRVRCLAAV